MFLFKAVNIVKVFCMFFITILSLNFVVAQSVVNVSGVWQVKFKGIEKGCKQSEENGEKKGGYSFEVQQQDNSIFSMFDDKTTINIVEGQIKENLIRIVVKGSTNEGCRMKTVLNGQIINEKIIKGAYSGKFLNCEVCEWSGKFNVDIKR